MRCLFKAALAALLFSGPAVFAGAFTEVDLPPIEHDRATLVVVDANGLETAYSPAELEALPTYRLTTRTPWRDEPAMFEGVLLNDLLLIHGLDRAPSIAVTAENDYQTSLSRDLLDSVEILLATRVDGRPHTRRARGPIQFVLDLDTFNSSELTSGSNYVWMAARIEPGQ